MEEKSSKGKMKSQTSLETSSTKNPGQKFASGIYIYNHFMPTRA